MTTTREHPAAFRPRTTNAEAFVAVKAAIAGGFKRRSSRQLPEPPNLLPTKCRPETITSRSIAARHQPISLPSQKHINLQSESRPQYNTIKRQKPLSCRPLPAIRLFVSRSNPLDHCPLPQSITVRVDPSRWDLRQSSRPILDQPPIAQPPIDPPGA